MYSELDRIGVGIGAPAARRLRLPFKNYLAGAPARRFYCSHRENLRPFIQKNFPQWIDRAVDEAERLCRHEVTLLGYGPVELGREIDWHRDPVTGQVWERRFWADYRPEHDSAGRDPKIIHELNRHQHLPRLAKAYLLTGDERYAGEAVAQLNSWIDQNPPGLGINWQSSLEIGIRAISWLWTIFPLLPSRSFDEASAQRIGDSLFAQLEHVHRYTSVFSSPNTHLIGEAAALFIAGLVFRDRKRPAVWLRRAAALLTEAAEKQVLDDGVYGELSSCYHCYALDFYLQAIVLAEQNEFHFPEPVPHKVRGMLQFLMHLTRPDGTIPLLGDDDGGRALALDKRNYRSFQDGLCLGAVLFRRGDFKHQAGAFCEEALWLLGEDAWEIYRQLESQAAGGDAEYLSARRIPDSALRLGAARQSPGFRLRRTRHAHRRPRSRRCPVGHPVQRGPGTARGPGNVCLQRRSGMAQLFSLHASSQHRHHRRPGSGRTGRNFSLEEQRSPLGRRATSLRLESST